MATAPQIISESNHAARRSASANRRTQVAGSKRNIAPITLPPKRVQLEIIRRADELALMNDPRETSAAIASDMCGLEQRQIDRVLDIHRIAATRGLKTLRRFTHDGLIASGQVMRAVAGEVA